MHSPLAMRKMQYSGLIIGVSILFLKLSTKNISYFDIEIIKAKYLFSDFCLILVQVVFAFFSVMFQFVSDTFERTKYFPCESGGE